MILKWNAVWARGIYKTFHIFCTGDAFITEGAARTRWHHGKINHLSCRVFVCERQVPTPTASAVPWAYLHRKVETLRPLRPARRLAPRETGTGSETSTTRRGATPPASPPSRSWTSSRTGRRGVTTPQHPWQDATKTTCRRQRWWSRKSKWWRK